MRRLVWILGMLMEMKEMNIETFVLGDGFSVLYAQLFS